jgi:aspartokinase/homoserine dehydrogenase 1
MMLHSRGTAGGLSHARQAQAPLRLSAPSLRISEAIPACPVPALMPQGAPAAAAGGKPRRTTRGRRQQHICSVLMEDKPAVADKFMRGSHWQVHKFGGTCMAAAERIRAAAELILKEPGECKVVVVSAMGSHPTSPAKVTDLILDMIKRAARQDAAFLLDLAALQDKHVETAKLLLGQGPELTGFVSRLLDDIANLKAMLQAMSIGACLQQNPHQCTRNPSAHQ